MDAAIFSIHAIQSGGHLLRQRVIQRAGDALLITEVMVDRSDADTGFPTDVLKGSSKVAVRAKKREHGIQHPLAQSWMALEAADLMVWHAARLYDAGKPCGAEANSAKFLAADAAFDACDRAVRTFGGFGYAKEYHVERYFREIVLPRIAPVTRELIMSFIAERVLELPKSY